jgi:hypothetical protein
MRFEVLTAASMKMAVFGVVAPCSLVEVYQTTRRNNPEDSHLIHYFFVCGKPANLRFASSVMVFVVSLSVHGS